MLGLQEIYEDEDYVYLLQEYMAGGNLKDFMASHEKPLDHLVVRSIAHQIAMAVYYLSTFQIIHWDIKPSNILLTGDYLKYYD